MTQHIINGFGPPTERPYEVSQHYLDFSNGDVYISVGTNHVSDWGTPLVKTEKLDATIRELLAAMEGRDDMNLIVVVEAVWDELDQVKRAKIRLPGAIGSLIRVVDDTGLSGKVQLYIDRNYNIPLREGLNIPVLNHTTDDMTIASNSLDDRIDFAGERNSEPVVIAGGYANVRYLGLRGMGFHFYVTGDTNRLVRSEDVDVITNETYDTTLDELTKAFVDAATDF